jgi:hypothetical protein
VDEKRQRRKRKESWVTDETFCASIRLYIVKGIVEDMRQKAVTIMNIPKLPPILEDLRSHAPEEMAELRVLLAAGAAMRPDPRRPGFYEVQGVDRVFYIFKYPSGTKILLIGVWDRDVAAELASACACPAA